MTESVPPLTPAGRRPVRFAGLFLFVSLSVGLWLTAPEAHAQAAPDSSSAARFQLADAYLRAGQFDRAIAILRSLHEENPGTFVFYSKLRQAFEETKRYDEAIALIDRRVSLDAVPTALLSDKARLSFLSGDEVGAYAIWSDAVDTAPDQAGTYRTVYQSMTQVRKFEPAVEVLLLGRERLGNVTLFQAELGYLYGMTSRHELAAVEYLGLIENDPRQLATVKSRIARFAGIDGVVEAAIRRAETAVRDQPLNRSYRELLAWLYVEARQYDDAFTAYLAIDRLEKEEGRVLFGFAGKAAAGGAYQTAISAYEEIETRYSASSIAAEALRGKAEAYVRWADQERDGASNGTSPEALSHYDKALATFDLFLERHPLNPNYPYVLLERGRLQQDVYGRYDKALADYERLRNRFAEHPAAHQAAFHTARIFVSRDQLQDARLLFARLEEALRTGDLAERARFEVGMVLFFQGDLDAAMAVAEALKENTSNDTANDAIELKMLLIENRGPDSLDTPLRSFARVRLLQRQGQDEEALGQLDTLSARFAGHSLADELLFERAGILRLLDRHQAAYESFASLPLIHPDSFLADRSLFAAAELLETRLGDPEAAAELYGRILLEFPGSLLIPEVRSRIRALRGDGT